MKLKHTPGPWAVTDDAEVGSPDRVFVSVFTDGYYYDVAEVLPDNHEDPSANARLIAAAPEMLDALLYVANDDGCPDDVTNVILSALRKAGY